MYHNWVFLNHSLRVIYYGVMFWLKAIALATLQLLQLYWLDSILKRQMPALYDHTNLSIFSDLLYFLYSVSQSQLPSKFTWIFFCFAQQRWWSNENNEHRKTPKNCTNYTEPNGCTSWLQCKFSNVYASNILHLLLKKKAVKYIKIQGLELASMFFLCDCLVQSLWSKMHSVHRLYFKKAGKKWCSVQENPLS